VPFSVSYSAFKLWRVNLSRAAPGAFADTLNKLLL